MIFMDGLISLILAIVGLGILIFIHELGHYCAARWVGMRVEVFSIGFGKPLVSFWHRGVRINICWIPFGGYVKIAGMDKKSSAQDLEGNFFSKPPLSRICVALAGPFANVLFGFFVFTVIWVAGGREKPFASVTQRIGWVDPHSTLYAEGVRPGDKIVAYNDHRFQSSRDHLYAPMTSGPSVKVIVEKSKARTTETIQVAPYQHPYALEKGILTSGVLSSANFLIWKPHKVPEPLLAEQERSGILPGDRLVWMDGSYLFSHMQLQQLLHTGSQFMTVLRDNTYLQLKIPRVLAGEMKLTQEMRGELSDWQYEADLQMIPFNELWFIPYNLTSDAVVESAISLFELDQIRPHRVWYDVDRLLPGDRIVAIAGKKISASYEVVERLQEKRVSIVVDRNPRYEDVVSLTQADVEFEAVYQSSALHNLVQRIGTPQQMEKDDSFVLLSPIVPQTRREFLRKLSEYYPEQHLSRDSTEEVDEKPSEKQENLLLGLIGVYDETVQYNPNPIESCVSIVREIKQTIVALVGGYLSPRWMSGPVGILHMMQQQSAVGYIELLFWLGTISLNLAVLNLIPLPVLDGGYILFSLFEMVTGVRVKVEWIEKIVVPFAVLLILLLLYLTYYDILRVIQYIFSHWMTS